jgi:hypothetical protein
MRILIALGALLLATSAAAQQPPPIQGVTGTIATEGTRDAEKKAAGKVARGVKKILPGKKGDAENPLDAFTDGLKVAVRDGDDTTEGVVIDVNRTRNQITVRLTPTKTQTLRLSDPAVKKEEGVFVVVSYRDPSGTRISRDFKRVS